MTLVVWCLSAEPVFIGIDEKLSVVLSKTGGLESLEVQGTMSLVIGSEADAYVSIAVSSSACPPGSFGSCSSACRWWLPTVCKAVGAL